MVVLSRDRPVARTLVSHLTSLVGPELAAAVSDPDLPVPGPHRVIRVGPEPHEWAAAGADIGKNVTDQDAVDCLLPSVSAQQASSMARGLVLGCQRLGDTPVADVQVWVPGPGDRVAAARDGVALGERVLLARGLANTPSNIKTPDWLAEQASAVAGGSLSVSTHDPQWLARQGFGGILAVGAGSVNPPNLTRLDYRGRPDGPHIVIVGKGITFDSGGLSLKPAASMPLMKTDMSGAAAVIATLAALRDAEVPARVTGLIACAENMPGGSAMRPGDVIRHYGGRTTEVLNTDAEGRLVLADALAYASGQLRPDMLVDLATLTGAATMGLGRQNAALYSTSDRMARDLTAAGVASADLVWRMPLVSEYAGAIESDIADAANTNTDSVTHAGSITAALFLQPFAGAVPWAHLDIAGTGRTESDRADCRKGATGFGVGLLTQWISRLIR